MPHERNDFFTGRTEVLASLHASLSAASAAALTQPQAISGLGGIGKTQTALEYAYRYGHEYNAVFWVGAETEQALIAGFVDIARLLGLPGVKLAEQDVTVQGAKRWLEANDGWLLIFDNADKPEIVKPYRPRNAKGHILLTSRDHVFDQLGVTKPTLLDKMPPEEARNFFISRTNRDMQDPGEFKAADDLARELDYLRPGHKTCC